MEGDKETKRSWNLRSDKGNHGVHETSNITKEAMKTGPTPRLLDASLVRESEMMESVEESSIKVYSQHFPHGFIYQNCWGSGHVNAASDIFFVKEEFSSSSELGVTVGPSDNDQHSPVKPRNPSPSSARTRGLKHNNECKHLEGTYVKRRREEEALSWASRRRLEFRPNHTLGTSDKDQCSTVDPKGKSVLHWSRETDGIGVMWGKSEVAFKNGIPEDDVLEGLALKIPQHWKKLGRRLNVKQGVLDAINKEEEEYSEKAYKMLLKWKRARGGKATFKGLYDALCHDYVDRKDLAEQFCCVP